MDVTNTPIYCFNMYYVRRMIWRRIPVFFWALINSSLLFKFLFIPSGKEKFSIVTWLTTSSELTISILLGLFPLLEILTKSEDLFSFLLLLGEFSSFLSSGDKGSKLDSKDLFFFIFFIASFFHRLGKFSYLFLKRKTAIIQALKREN